MFCFWSNKTWKCRCLFTFCACIRKDIEYFCSQITSLRQILLCQIYRNGRQHTERVFNMSTFCLVATATNGYDVNTRTIVVTNGERFIQVICHSSIESVLCRISSISRARYITGRQTWHHFKSTRDMLPKCNHFAWLYEMHSKYLWGGCRQGKQGAVRLRPGCRLLLIWGEGKEIGLPRSHASIPASMDYIVRLCLK